MDVVTIVSAGLAVAPGGVSGAVKSSLSSGRLGTILADGLRQIEGLDGDT